MAHHKKKFTNKRTPSKERKVPRVLESRKVRINRNKQGKPSLIRRYEAICLKCGRDLWTRFAESSFRSTSNMSSNVLFTCHYCHHDDGKEFCTKTSKYRKVEGGSSAAPAEVVMEPETPVERVSTPVNIEEVVEFSDVPVSVDNECTLTDEPEQCDFAERFESCPSTPELVSHPTADVQIYLQNEQPVEVEYSLTSSDSDDSHGNFVGFCSEHDALPAMEGSLSIRTILALNDASEVDEIFCCDAENLLKSGVMLERLASFRAFPDPISNVYLNLA